MNFIDGYESADDFDGGYETTEEKDDGGSEPAEEKDDGGYDTADEYDTNVQRIYHDGSTASTYYVVGPARPDEKNMYLKFKKNATLTNGACRFRQSRRVSFDYFSIAKYAHICGYVSMFDDALTTHLDTHLLIIENTDDDYEIAISDDDLSILIYQTMLNREIKHAKDVHHETEEVQRVTNNVVSPGSIDNKLQFSNFQKNKATLTFSNSHYFQYFQGQSNLNPEFFRDFHANLGLYLQANLLIINPRDSEVKPTLRNIEYVNEPGIGLPETAVSDNHAAILIYQTVVNQAMRYARRKRVQRISNKIQVFSDMSDKKRAMIDIFGKTVHWDPVKQMYERIDRSAKRHKPPPAETTEAQGEDQITSSSSSGSSGSSSSGSSSGSSSSSSGSNEYESTCTTFGGRFLRRSRRRRRSATRATRRRRRSSTGPRPTRFRVPGRRKSRTLRSEGGFRTR